MRILRLSILLFTFAAGVGRFVSPAYGSGQATEAVTPPYTIQSLTQYDTNGDARSDMTVIQMQFITSNDRVTVYDGGSDMQNGTTWEETTDLHNDTWVFDIGSDNTAQLIIRFNELEDKLQAQIFNDLDGDGAVDYTTQNGLVTVTEALYPSIVAEVQNDWWLPDGHLNWNVAFYTDGNGLTLYNSSGYSVNFTKTWRSFMELDGTPDAVMQFYDENNDGTPESGIWRLLVNTPRDMGAERTWVWRNVGQVETPPHPDYIFWPYLITARISRYEQGIFRGVEEVLKPESGLNYFDTPPSVEVGWLTGLVSPMQFRGYPIEEGFHVNSEVYFEKDRINYTDFEIAQDYYDLAQDNDRMPELHIRHRYFGADDLYGWSLPSDLNEIRWSWNQSNAPGTVWDYKLGLAGRQHIDEVSRIGEFSYYAIPYLELPKWVIGESWDIVTFVSSEQAPFVSSEGIYPWGPIETPVEDQIRILSAYLSGRLELNINSVFTSIPEGLRGEYADNLSAQPYLYLSSIDYELHLLKAGGCLWNIDPDTQIVCDNLNGGDFINRWQYVVRGQPQRDLIKIDGFLILQGESGVSFKQVSFPEEIFRTLPPTNHSTWMRLGQQLAQNEISFEPGDFFAMFDRVEGPVLQIDGAQFEDFRIIENGFRLVLELNSDSETKLLPGFPDLTNLSAGKYMIEMQDGTFTVLPLTPPELVLTTSVEIAPIDEFTTPGTVNISVRVENQGLQDLSKLTVETFIDSEDGNINNRLWVGLDTVDALGESARSYTYTWVPNRTGNWVVRSRITDRTVEEVAILIQTDSDQDNIQAYTSSAINYTVQTVTPVSPTQFLTLGNEQPFSGIGILVLWIAVGISAVSLFGLIIIEIRILRDE